LIVGRADKLFFGRRSLPGHVFTLENGYHFSVTILSHFVVSDSVWKWIHGLGGPGLILLGLSDNTPFVSAPPGSVDVCVILLAAHRPEWWAYYAFMTTVGEVLGGYLTYRLSKKGGKQTLERKVGKQRAEMVYRGFEKFGSITVLAGALLPPPFPFTSVLMTAGVMQYPRKKFLPALMVGCALLCGVLAGQNLWPADDRLLLAELPVACLSPDRDRWDGRHRRTGLLRMVSAQEKAQRKRAE
jgi:membrane protein YqaA with SNARE-associated domain